MKTKIYVATHKEFDYKLPSIYDVILVGSFNKDIKKYIRDDSGNEQISNKNNNYCELTGLYWIWKNDNSDIIGLCHYRRYFKGKDINKVLSENEILKYLNKYDIILPTKWYYKYNIYESYKNKHFIKDMDNCKKIIEKLYPDYIDTFNKIMNRKYIYLYNMFIAKKDIMNDYFEWIFSIFNKLEKITKLDGYDDYQKRIYGFLSERLFNVWIEYNHLKIKEIPVYQVGRSVFSNNLIIIKSYIKKVIYKNKK